MNKGCLAGVLVCAGLVPWSVSAQSLGFDKIPLELTTDCGCTHKAWVFFTEHAGKEAYVPFNRRSKDRRAKMGLTAADERDLHVSPEYRRAVENLGAVIRTESRWFNAVTVEATPEELREIARLPFVRLIEQVVGTVREKAPARGFDFEPVPPMFATPDTGSPAGDIDYGASKSQLGQIRVPELHARGLTGKGVTVCILDVGFRWSHAAFHKAKLLGQWDFVMNDGNVQRDPGNRDDFEDEHGTMTWSILGGYAPGKVIGPAFGAGFLLARTEDGRSETPLEEDYWVTGLEWCDASGADIVSSSLGYRHFDDPSLDHPYKELDGRSTRPSMAANIASTRGILVVNSVGNEGDEQGSLNTPADSLGVLAVGAVSRSGGAASFSSSGPTADGRIKPDVMACGVQACVATNGGYGRADGTSFSAPLAAGAAALVLEANPKWTPGQLMEALTQTASQASAPDNRMGYGLLNATAAAGYSPKAQTGRVASLSLR